MDSVVILKTNRSYYSATEARGDSISVGDLIDLLKHYDEDDKVIFSNDGGYTYGYICSDCVDDIRVETEEEIAYREKMEELEEELNDLESDYENPYCLEEDRMTTEEYHISRQEILDNYNVTLEEYLNYVGRR